MEEASIVFIKPMNAKSASKEGVKLGDPRYVAEPKLDGDRGQFHVRDWRTAAIWSRLGNSWMGDPGLKRLVDYQWPVRSAVLDTEVHSGDGRNAAGRMAAQITTNGQSNVTAFDLLMLEDLWIKDQPWTERRGLLDSLSALIQVPGFSTVAFTDDHQGLWDEWVGKYHGEGIMLKGRTSRWIAGIRSPQWLKVKVEETFDVVIVGVTSKATYSGQQYKTGEVALTYGMYHEGQLKQIGQGLEIGSRAEMEKLIGCVAEVRCNGMFPSGSLRGAQFVRWRTDKAPEDCVREDS